MKRRSEEEEDWEATRARILGLGERSIHKSHYPELQRRIAELAASEEKYRSLLNNLNVGIIRTTAELPGRFLEANPAAVRILGHESVASLMERRVESIYDNPDDRRHVIRELSERGAVRNREVLGRRRDGSTIWLSLSAVPHRAPGGEIDWIDSVLEDISERKELQGQLLQAQKMEALGRLAGGIAHDFNNMLTAITGYNELLTISLAADDPNRGLVDEVAKAAGRAADLTRHLLAFARKQPMNLQVVGLNDIVVETRGMLRRLIGEHIELETDLAPEQWTVRADPAQLQQVLVNLGLNARDAMKSGGRLRVASRNEAAGRSTCAQCAEDPAADHVVLLVSDTGDGIAPEDQPRVFEPFFSTKGAGGTGLGLATVYGTVRQSGGHVSVESAPGKGATFRVCLPRADGGGEARREPAPAARAAHGRELVLLVEDDAAIRGLLARVLRNAGYALIEARDGAEALSAVAARGRPPDLVVTDIVMPAMAGTRLVERLAREHRALRVIYISGYPASEHLHVELPRGTTFLAKPFSPTALLQKVRDALDAP